MKYFTQKTSNFNKLKYKAVCFSVLCSLTIGCGVTNRITVKDDVVYSSKRVELKLIHEHHNMWSPLQQVSQSFVKEINRDNQISYKVFDNLRLAEESFKLDDKVFLIVDDKAFQVTIEGIESENVISIFESKENLQKADSTTISVVTGYSQNKSKITRLNYRLTDEMVTNIKGCKQLKFRYYSGPDMLTVTLNKRKIKKVKELINRS